MARTTMITTTSSTIIVPHGKSPNTICSGFIDINGIWNNGFVCPVQNFIQYFCCETNTYHYCCALDHYLSERNSHSEQTYMSGQYQPSNHIIINENYNNSFINRSNIIDKQFEQFQKVFIPIFLLSSSILFLIGIAIWFWLYKHKAFYAMERDNFNKKNQTSSRSSQSMFNNFLNKKENNIHINMKPDVQRISYPSTEV
ncbi:unnamed protein product [Rotaria sp. Silwood1]|nr:unnamed protein product [Rotaria sp. Silwood1]CAF3412554.1 unnamed protein product [Rotaria sp. Silwood1]CAF4667480.1 unnamed protein product [Rotaria sp. Silwood1]CAF4838497.1 unnamed protein product [Rotaria sp. Silwood1]